MFTNGHEIYSRVGDMSRTVNHLFVVINMPTQISHTCLRAGDIYLVEEQGIPFPHHEDTVDVDTPNDTNNVKHANVIKPGNR